MLARKGRDGAHDRIDDASVSQKMLAEPFAGNMFQSSRGAEVLLWWLAQLDIRSGAYVLGPGRKGFFGFLLFQRIAR